MWETLSGALLQFLQEWGEVALFLVFLLEETGVPLPLPGDLALIWAGYRVASGRGHFVVVLLVVELATVLGASSLYWLARWGGRPLLVRYGRFLHIDEAKLRRAEGWVGRNATLAILLGRIVPGCRIATPLAAGVFRVGYRTFLPPLAAGTCLHVAFWLGVGAFFGPGIMSVLEGPRLSANVLVSSVLLAGLLLLTWRIHRRVLPGRREAGLHVAGRRRVEAAALAGLLATIEMASAVSILLTALAAVGIGLPERALLQAGTLITSGHGTRLGTAFLPVAATTFLLGGLLWALVYGLWAEPRLRGPDWAKGVVFSLLPTGVSTLVVLPLLGAGPLGLELQTGALPVLGELVRHLLYGAALGLAYPVLVLARQPHRDTAAVPSLGLRGTA